MSDEHPVDPLDEELVAYLDEELEAAERARIERRLAEDEDYRERLRRLQQTWDALDLLPKAAASDGFASTTVGMVAAREEESLTQAVQSVVSRRQQRRLWITAAGMAAAAAGFAVMYYTVTADDRELVKDLPVIERVDQLQNTPSVEFLEKLREERLFLADSNEP